MNRQPKEMLLSEDLRILFEDVKLLQPALDCNEETLFVTVPLLGKRTMEDKKGNVEERAEVVLCTITDKREIFEAKESQFIVRGLLAKIPHPIIEQRWSASSIQTFIEGNAPLVDPWDIFSSIKEKFDQYVDFGINRNASTVCAVYVVATYFFFLFEYFPYLKFGGEKGAGKTKTGTIFASLCFNGQIFANATKAAIYRTAQDTRGTMVIDEGEGLAQRTEEMAAYLEVLNSGWQRNGYAILTDKESLKPTKFSTFSPKVICSISGLDEVLDDRAFEVILFKTLDRTKANSEVSLTSAEWQQIRDNLYLLLLQKWKEVRELILETRNDYNFSGRIWNLAKPLIVVAKFLDKYKPNDEQGVEQQVLEFIEMQLARKSEKAREGFASSVIVALKELLKSGAKTFDGTDDTYQRVSLNDLTDSVREIEKLDKLSSRTVARTLTNLGLYNDVRRDGKKGERRFGVRLSQVRDAEERLFGKVTDVTDDTDDTDDEKEGNESQLSSSDTHFSSSDASNPSSVTSETSVSSVNRKQDGTCELCGKYAQLTRSKDGDLVCSECLKEGQEKNETHNISVTSVTSVTEDQTKQPEPKCPTWMTTDEWSKLSLEEKERVLEGQAPQVKNEKLIGIGGAFWEIVADVQEQGVMTREGLMKELCERCIIPKETAEKLIDLAISQGGFIAEGGKLRTKDSIDDIRSGIIRIEKPWTKQGRDAGNERNM